MNKYNIGPERPITRLIFNNKTAVNTNSTPSNKEKQTNTTIVRNVPINCIDLRNDKYIPSKKCSPPIKSKSSKHFKPAKTQPIRRTKSVLPEMERYIFYLITYIFFLRKGMN